MTVEIFKELEGKNVLVTGGTGYIGHSPIEFRHFVADNSALQATDIGPLK